VPFDHDTQLKLDANRRNWDARTPVHVASKFYGIQTRDPNGWIAPFEWRDLGDLSGRDVVHLQCHLGVETMALAMRGAQVTGLDFSGTSIEQARIAARARSLEIEYVEADVYDAVAALGVARFDIAYTGKGSLCYLPDLARWADVVARLLRPDGFLYVAEFHPLLNALGPSANSDPGDDLTIRHDYLEGRGALARDSTHTYTDGPALAGDTLHYEWTHGLGEVVNALVRAGLVISRLTETELLPWQRWGAMVRTDSGWWSMPDGASRVPLMYGLKAHKPGRPS
jgi:SAM-dependent methyltransferase